jgi:hypothetical protein
MNPGTPRDTTLPSAPTLLARPGRAAIAATLLLAAAAGRAETQPIPSEAPGGTPPSATAAPAAPSPAALLAEEPKAPPSNLLLAWIEGPVGVSLALNIGGRLFMGEDTFDVTFQTWIDNLQAEWEYDPNTFQTNQFAHPYQGSLYMTSARSLGVGFYTSALITTFGSWIWETAMEIHPPSINDQITTSVAGTLFGEALFRLSTISLGSSAKPGFWRELGAAGIAPMHGVNRLAFGNRYRDRRLNGFPWYGELVASVGVAGQFHQDGESADADEHTVTLAGRVSHGLLGAEGWRFRRPFDHFEASFALTINANSLGAEAFGSLLARGLLAGKSYGEGVNAGLWGLFAAYDFIAPQVFRASSSNVALGTVGQRELGRRFTLFGTVYAGLGFGAGGVSEEVEGQRDYHFGAQAVGFGELGLTWAKRVRFRGTARLYLTGEKVSPDPDSYEDIQYGTAELVYRVAGPHALGLGYTGGRRKARYPDIPDVKMSVNELSVSYRFVSDPGLGVGY